MVEFGDPSIEENGISEAIELHRKDGPSSNTIAAIELEEIPRVRELLSSVNNSSGEVLDEPQYCKFLLRFSYLMVMYLLILLIFLVAVAPAGEVSVVV
jgi:hypothetical protein